MSYAYFDLDRMKMIVCDIVKNKKTGIEEVVELGTMTEINKKKKLTNKKEKSK